MQFGNSGIEPLSTMVMMTTQRLLSTFYRMLSFVFVVISCLCPVPCSIFDGFSLVIVRLWAIN